jgi:hypothetical protein
MSKTAIDWSRLDDDPTLIFAWPVLLSAHANGSSPDPAQFHTLYASFGYFSYGATLFYLPIHDWNWGDDLIITPEQIGLANFLIHNSHDISQCCTDCNARSGVWHAIRFNHTRHPQYDYDCPACLGDGSWPLSWSPQQSELLLWPS